LQTNGQTKLVGPSGNRCQMGQDGQKHATAEEGKTD
jgi:hypothetical protein